MFFCLCPEVVAFLDSYNNNNFDYYYETSIIIIKIIVDNFDNFDIKVTCYDIWWYLFSFLKNVFAIDLLIFLTHLKYKDEVLCPKKVHYQLK